MKKVLNWIYKLIGVRKVIRFEQTTIYSINEKTTAEAIRKILEESDDDAQFHVGIELEIPVDDKCGEMLIQRDLSEKDFFFVCRSVQFSITPWQRMHIDNVVSQILSTKHSECKKFEKWKLLTRAIEGKSYGEY